MFNNDELMEVEMLFKAPMPPQQSELDALTRLVNIALHPSGQSQLVASFLLAWWNAAEHGGFDMTDLWGVDKRIADDMLSVFGLIARFHHYPDTVNPSLHASFIKIVALWKTEVTSI